MKNKVNKHILFVLFGIVAVLYSCNEKPTHDTGSAKDSLAYTPKYEQHYKTIYDGGGILPKE